MSIVGGLDVHRRQITFDYMDTETGRVRGGVIAPADRGSVRAWLAERFGGRGDVTFAVEAGTGWRYVTEELTAAGAQARLAEPAGTSAKRGPKRRAKTDRADARLLRPSSSSQGKEQQKGARSGLQRLSGRPSRDPARETPHSHLVAEPIEARGPR